MLVISVRNSSERFGRRCCSVVDVLGNDLSILLFSVIDLDVEFGHFIRQILPHLFADLPVAVAVVAVVATFVPRTAGRRHRR